MIKNIRNHIKGKWLPGVLISLVAFFVIVLVLLPIVLGPIVKDLLIQQIKNQTKGVYHLEIGDLELGLLSGNINASQLHLQPSDVVTQAQDFFEISAREINIQGISLWKILFKNEVAIEELALLKPEVKWIRDYNSQNLGQKSHETNMHKEKLPPVHIDKISMAASSFEVSRKDSPHPMISLDKASFRIENFVYDQADTSKKLSPFDFEEFTFLLEDYSMKLPDSLYILHFDSLKAAVSSSSVLVSGIKLTPRYDNVEFPKRKGEQTDRIEFYNKTLKVLGIDFKRLKEKQEFVASFIKLDSINLLAFRDKRYILPQDKYVTLPQQALRELAFYTKVDSMQLSNVQITYRERVAESSQAGTLNFTDLNGMVYNITNDSLLLKKGIAMEIQASAYLMGTGKIEAEVHIPIADPNNAHYFEGSLSPMKIEVVNPMTRHIVFGEFVSGKVNSLHFQARLNETASKGDMHFAYENLKVQINKKGEENNKKSFMSFFANTFIVKSANPLNGKFREGTMYYERDKRKSFINYWWKTLLSGFKDVIDIPKKEEEKEG